MVSDPGELLGRRRFLQAGCALTLFGLLPACAPQQRLRIASLVWPSYELMFLARREGWIMRQRVDLIETGSTTESMQAIRDGNADGAAMTLDEVLRMHSSGHPMVVVMVFNISAGADVVLARSEIPNLQALKGCRIGAEFTGLGALVLNRLLAAARLSREDVEVVPLTWDRHMIAWQEGLVDVLITFEPVAGQLRRDGARVLFDSRAIPDTIFDVLAVTEEASRVHRNSIQHLTEGYFRALEYLRTNPEQAAGRMADRLGVEEQHALELFEGIILPDVRGNKRLLGEGKVATAAESLSELMLQDGLLHKAPDIRGLVSTAYLPGLENM